MTGPDKSKLDFIIIGAEEAWEVRGMGTRGPFLERAIARSERVSKILVVNNPRSFAGRIKDRMQGVKSIEDIYPVRKKGKGWSLVTVGPKHFMLNATLIMPEHDGPALEFERRWFLRVLDDVRQDLQIKDPVLWISNPRIVSMARDIKARLRVFDTEDNLLSHPQNLRFRQKIEDGYAWAGANSDLIILLSARQRGIFSGAIPEEKFFVLPNGVDSALFMAPAACPQELKEIGSPVVLYQGVLQERLDVDLMIRVVRTLQNYHFIFVGIDITKGYFNQLKREPNVRFLGFKHRTMIPAYLQHSDVCVLPHKVNELTKSMDPLKIYEYLACGKPIVSTTVAGTENFRKYIYLADDPASFADAIKTAKVENSGVLEEERRYAASLNSWDVRANDIINKIDAIATKE